MSVTIEKSAVNTHTERKKGKRLCVANRRVKPNLWSSVQRHGHTESPLRRGKPSQSLSPWPDVHLPIFLTISLRQYIAVYLVGRSIATLDSGLRHLANPLTVGLHTAYDHADIAKLN